MNTTAAKACVCSTCGHRAHSIPGTQHRRCGGGDGAPLRSKAPLIVTPREPQSAKWKPVTPRTRGDGFHMIQNSGGASLSSGPGKHSNAGKWQPV